MNEGDITPAAAEPWPAVRTRPDFVPGPAGGAEALPAAPRAIPAEWALWGKEAHETSYHVLRCSKGTLREKDFSETITRYSPGEIDDLPHYTVSWIPGSKREPEYIALAVHELAPSDPLPRGGRSSRDAVGREIVFIRLYCVRYADLTERARHYQDQALGYQDLIKAVDGIWLPPEAAGPVMVDLPDALLPIVRRAPLRKQAEQVATVLLTGRQVCVLGADDVSAVDRLRFIDSVMAMLPYGLRATMSAATSASSTSADLKLRLFFASAPRAPGLLGDGRPRATDFCVEWGRQADVNLPDEAARLYQEWLEDVKSRAPAMLAEQGKPVRFAAEEIHRMVGNLPADKTVAATLDDLGQDLRAADRDAVNDAVKRLRRYLAGEDKPADTAATQRDYQHRVLRNRLLADYERLSPDLKGKLYDQLLPLAFGPALTYAGFHAIEESAGVPLPSSLRSALARFTPADELTYILTCGSRPRALDELRAAGVPAPPTEPLDAVIRGVMTGTLQPRHGQIVLGWSLRYLRRHSDDPGPLLAARGYLAPVCEYVYRGDQTAQVTQLRRVLDIVFGGQLGRPQIDQVFQAFGHPGYPPTAALRDAVAVKTARRNQQYLRVQVAEAFMRAQGAPGPLNDQERESRWRGWRPWRARQRARRPAASPGDFIDQPRPGAPARTAGIRNHALSRGSSWAYPRTTLTFGLAVILALFFVAYLIAQFVLRHG